MCGWAWASMCSARLAGAGPNSSTTPRSMETHVNYRILAAVAAISLALPLVGSASAQTHSPENISSCNQAVGQMKFEGWPADRNREMMMNACLSNNGTVPGAQTQTEQKPVSLKQKKLERQRTAPGG